MADMVAAITLALSDMRPEYLRRLHRVDPAGVAMFRDNMRAQGVGYSVRALRVAVFAAATFSRAEQPGELAHLPIEIGRASGGMAGGEGRVHRIIAALRSEDDDDLSLDELRKRAAQMAQYATQRLRVGDLWRASSPNASPTALHTLIGAALNQAQRQRQAAP